jgi:hypothetical protein
MSPMSSEAPKLSTYRIMDKENIDLKVLGYFALTEFGIFNI